MMPNTDMKARLRDYTQGFKPPAYKIPVTLVDSLFVELLTLPASAIYTRRNQMYYLVCKEIEQIEKWKRK